MLSDKRHVTFDKRRGARDLFVNFGGYLPFQRLASDPYGVSLNRISKYSNSLFLGLISVVKTDVDIRNA